MKVHTINLVPFYYRNRFEPNDKKIYLSDACKKLMEKREDKVIADIIRRNKKRERDKDIRRNKNFNQNKVIVDYNNIILTFD